MPNLPLRLKAQSKKMSFRLQKSKHPPCQLIWLLMSLLIDVFEYSKAHATVTDLQKQVGMALGHRLQVADLC